MQIRDSSPFHTGGGGNAIFHVVRGCAGCAVASSPSTYRIHTEGNCLTRSLIKRSFLPYNEVGGIIFDACASPPPRDASGPAPLTLATVRYHNIIIFRSEASSRLSAPFTSLYLLLPTLPYSISQHYTPTDPFMPY